jgi:uncharacterized damage-inducible protein DinB
MKQQVDWFSRSFSFELPVWMFPNILERLRGTPPRLEDRLKPLPQDLLVRRVDDRWSIQENAGHLLDLESLWVGRVHDFLAGTQTLRAADLANKKTYEANHNATPLEEILGSFRTVRLGWVQRLEDYDEALILRSAVHPRLKTEMRLIDLAFFVAEHDDHHLVEITSLLGLFKL